MPLESKQPIPLPALDNLRRFLSLRRSKLGLTYDQLALASGVSRRTIVSIETGNSPGSMATWYRLAAALNIGFDELFASAAEQPAAKEPSDFLPANF